MIADSTNLNRFGWINTIDTLAGNDHTKWNDVLSVSFERTITKILLNRERSEYQKRLHEAMAKERERTRPKV